MAAPGGVHLSAEQLQITWGEDRQYWEMVPGTGLGSAFSHKVARLKRVCWFDVKGEVKVRSLAPGTYTASWRLHLSDDAGGWDREAANFTSEKDKRGEDDIFRRQCYLKAPHSDDVPLSEPEPTVRDVGNGWTEYDVAEFTVEEGEGNLTLKFAMFAHSDNFWKTGLTLDGVFIRPETPPIHLSAEQLQITWGEDPQYWEMVPSPHGAGTLSNKIARLKRVCWFDVKGEIARSLPPGTYTASWRLHLSADAGGWDREAANFTSDKGKRGEDDIFKRQCYLKAPHSDDVPLSEPQPTVRAVGHGWSEYDVAKFAVEEGEGNLTLKFAMFAHSNNFWKTGLSLDGVVIRPALADD